MENNREILELLLVKMPYTLLIIETTYRQTLEKYLMKIVKIKKINKFMIILN
jgi:hypothetical protein